jgi:uncharacterized protein
MLRIERALLYYLIRLFRIRDATERVARGFAVGLMVNFYPTFGFGVLIAGVLSRLLGGNVIAGLVGGACLTFFWPFLFYLNLVTGGWMQGRFLVRDPSEITEAKMRSLVWGIPFTTGAIVNSVVLGIISYLLLLWLFQHYRPATLGLLHGAMKRHQRRRVRAALKKKTSLQGI